MKFILACSFLLIATLGYSQTNDKVSWSFDSKKTGNKEYTITFKGIVKDGWYIYSQYLESDDGPVRTQLVIENNPSIRPEGKPEETGTKVEGYDELFGMNIAKFKKSITITQKLTVDEPTTISGYITFMTCDNTQCLPPVDVPFEITLK